MTYMQDYNIFLSFLYLYIFEWKVEDLLIKSEEKFDALWFISEIMYQVFDFAGRFPYNCVWSKYKIILVYSA